MNLPESRDIDTFSLYAPLLYAEKEDCSIEEAREYFFDVLENKYPEIDSMDYLTQINLRKGIGASYFKENVFIYLKMNIEGFFAEMFGPNRDQVNKLPISNFLKQLFILAVMGMLALSYLIYATGFLMNFRKLTWLDWLLLLTTLYFMASTAVVGYSRFRMPFYPICLIGTFLCWRSRFKQSSTFGILEV